MIDAKSVKVLKTRLQCRNQQVLAKEEPDVRVLNYAPGPVETSMRNQLLEQSWAEEIKAGEALTTGMTCDRLLTLLAKDDYTSGAHIDYFDP